MTPEEKQLLLKDLSQRVSFGVCIFFEKTCEIFPLCGVKVDHMFPENDILVLLNDKYPIQWCKPYLRPMSSMTEEERENYRKALDKDFAILEDSIVAPIAYKYSDGTIVRDKPLFNEIDWLNKNGFDYRGLIPMGLALEAPEGMYNKEEPEKESEIPVPKTVDEAISTLEKILSDEDREYLLKNGAISMHDSLGRWIRNEWGLWTGSQLKDELMNMNKGLNHPDDMSNYIIEEFIKYWNNKV